MVYLTLHDLQVSLRAMRIDQITDGDTTYIDAAEDIALAVVKDSLSALHDWDAIIALQPRAPQVVNWVKVLTIYYIYERIPDKAAPDKVTKNYEYVQAFLKGLENGERNTTLPRKTMKDGESDEGHRFAWGSVKPRSH
jgi:Protein of unknown function (DUF1320)